MNLLAVDTAGENLSVALESEGTVFSLRRSTKIPHDEALLPAVESILKRAKIRWDDLDSAAVASGPGRFTGIRIGLSFAAMLGLKLRIPVLALSRLEAVAEVCPAGKILGALPGWKGEIYHQFFRRKKNLLATVGEAAWVSPGDWPQVRGEAEARGNVVSLRETDASDLLAVARRRLASKKIPPFKPFYLKPAGYERPRR